MLTIKETTQQFRHGQKLVGATVIKLIETNIKFFKGILLRAAGDNDPTPNTDVVWVGRSTVTASDGMPIAPGETLSLPLETADDLYAISTSASQSIAWWGM